MASLRSRIRNGRTYYSVRTASGKEYGAGWNRKTAKELFEHYDRLERLASHDALPPERSTWDLRQLRSWDLGSRHDPSRDRRWAVLLAVLGPHTLLAELSVSGLDAYRRVRMAGKASPATVNRDLSVLRSAWNRAKPLSGVQNDPFGGLQRLKEERPRPVALPPKTVQRILSTARTLAETPEERQDVAILELVYRTASRVSQILNLRWDQVRNGQVVFAPHKGGRERVFPYAGRIRRLMGRPNGSEWVFPSHRSEGPRRGFRRFLKRVLVRAEVVERVTPHTFRHSASSAAFLAGRPISEVQRLLGHGSPQMAIALYTQLFPAPIAPVPLRSQAPRAKRGSKAQVAHRKR